MVRGLVSLSCVLAVCGGMALARPVDDDKEDEGIPPDAAGGTLQRGDSPDHLPGHARGHGGSGSGVSFGSWGSGGAAEDHEPCGKRSERRPKKGMIISDITIHCLARGTQICRISCAGSPLRQRSRPARRGDAGVIPGFESACNRARRRGPPKANPEIFRKSGRFREILLNSWFQVS
jgi:hypothetical protein